MMILLPIENVGRKITSRDRPKSAPNLRLKNNKRTSKFQVFSFTAPEKPESWAELARQKGGAVRIFQHFCRKTSKQLKGDPLKTIKNFECLTMPKKLKVGPLVTPGIVCYAEKKEPLLYFSSLGQMVQFDTLILS